MCDRNRDDGRGDQTPAADAEREQLQQCRDDPHETAENGPKNGGRDVPLESRTDGRRARRVKRSAAEGEAASVQRTDLTRAP